MNVRDSCYEDLNLDPRLIKILQCHTRVKVQVTAAKNQAFRPTTTNQPQLPKVVKTPARNHTYQPNSKSEILGFANPHSSGCPHCRDLTEEQQCIRNFFVHDHKNLEGLTGIIVTDAPEDDRMRPKVSLLYFYLNGTETIT